VWSGSGSLWSAETTAKKMENRMIKTFVTVDYSQALSKRNSVRRTSRNRIECSHSSISFHHESAEDRDVHFGAQETVQRFFRTAHDRFIFVKGCIENQRDRGQSAESGYQRMKQWICLTMHGL